MAMRRDDLGRLPDTDPGPPTLEDALRVPDLEDGDLVRSLWDDLADEAAVVEPEVPATPAPPAPDRWADPVTLPPAPQPGPAAPPAEDPLADGPDPLEPVPQPMTRREARRRTKELKHLARVKKLEKRRHRILPRTVIGIASMLLFFGLGVGVAGAALYAYYDWRLSENEQRVGELSESLERRLLEANEELDVSAADSIQRIRQEVRPLRDLLRQEAVLADLTGAMAGRVWFVETLDENGAPSVGSAFVVASDEAQSLLVTSWSVVAAGTTEPAPGITLRSGDESLEAELYNWDPERDLALLVLPRGGLEPLAWAGERALADLVGEPVWAVQGIGGNGASVSIGTVIDQTATGIQHTAGLNAAFRGGPLVDGRGRVVAVASTAYSPLGYSSGDVAFAAPVQSTCERVLECSGDVPGSGDEG